MPPNARYVFRASMEVRPEQEAPFPEVYDREQHPNRLTGPGG